MNKFKTITAGAIATITMLTASISASASDIWSIDYTSGAPSSVSNQFVRKEYSGLSSTTTVYVRANVTLGSVALDTTGFNPNASSVVFSAPYDGLYDLDNPNPAGCSVKISANENRVVADGYISV